jgi:hypothetical protein
MTASGTFRTWLARLATSVLEGEADFAARVINTPRVQWRVLDQ